MTDNTRTPAELLFLVGFTCGLLTLAIVHALLPTRHDRELQLFRAVQNLAQETFVEELEPRDLVDDALRGMVGGLDPYSRYYGPAELEGIERETSGEYKGIGVLFLNSDSGVIRFPLPDSPAERAGLDVGDRIVEIDGQAVAELPPGGLRECIRAADDRTIQLEVENRAGERRTAELRPEEVVDPTVRHTRMLDEAIGYLAIRSFSRRTVEEFDAAVDWLRKQGMSGLVLDLRGNPGGILDSAVRIADRFVREGVLVSTRSRTETRSTHADPAETHLEGLPLVVLVDGNSASASEVLCGALQDHRVAVLAGEPTYGKGAVQTLSRFDHDQAIVKLTTSNYFTPAGRRIERSPGWKGLAPDVLVEVTGDQARAIRDFLESYSPAPRSVPALRAWEVEDQVELIAQAPPDPQLDTALDLLRGRAPGSAPLAHAD